MSDAIVTARSVHELPIDEKPRERLQRYGSSSLSDAELIAIILRTGTKGQNAVETGRKLIEMSGGIHRMGRLGWKDIRDIPGIADVKAITLEAVFELGRRIAAKPENKQIRIQCPEDVYEHFGPRLRDERVEVFIIAFLNAAKILTGYKVISRGGTTATIVEPGEVFRQAVTHDAHSIIAMHNHPSGSIEPSVSDKRLTQRLIDAGKILGITLEDHIIIAGYQFTSIRMKNLVHFEN